MEWNGIPIVTRHVYPPIPIRDFDWSACLDNYEPGCPVGEGPTEAAAIEDLLQLLVDDAQDRAEREMYGNTAKHTV